MSALDVDSWLKSFISEHGAAAGTVHSLKGETLELLAAVNIPPKVVELTRRIPKGKGMAGLAWERNEPVSTCNLKTDQTGDVRPGAKAVDASAAVALPIHAPDGAIRGVVGIAFQDERDISDSELQRLNEQAEQSPV